MLLTVVAVQFNDSGSATIYGVLVRQDSFFIAAFFISIFLIFAYCSSHLINYKTAEMFHALVEKMELRGSLLVDNEHSVFTWADFAHSLYTSNNNRVFPVEDQLEKLSQLSFLLRRSVRITYKRIVDSVYSTVPIIASIASIFRLVKHDSTGILAFLLLASLAVFSIVPWIALISKIFHWAERTRN